MSKYIDIHSHKSTANTLSIINCLPSEWTKNYSERLYHFYSIGLHPWHIQADYSKDWEELVANTQNTNVIAIGECGLDKLCKTPFELQKEVFTKHILLAEKLQKPLIIHCVKAYQDIIQLKKELKPTMPWILHGYRGNKETTLQLLAFNFYFSFGKGLSLLQESIKIIPLDRLFLETDDMESNIEEVYTKTSELLNFPVYILKNQIQRNFERLFSNPYPLC